MQTVKASAIMLLTYLIISLNQNIYWFLMPESEYILVLMPEWLTLSYLKEYFDLTLNHEQSGHKVADDIFGCILLKENACILILILLKFVQKFRFTTSWYHFR